MKDGHGGGYLWKKRAKYPMLGWTLDRDFETRPELAIALAKMVELILAV